MPHLPPCSKNYLTGTVAPELGSGWGSIESLALNNNSFTGSIPKEWANMKKLKKMYL